MPCPSANLTAGVGSCDAQRSLSDGCYRVGSVSSQLLTRSS